MAFEWDWKTAQLRRSLTLDPGSVTAWVSWARYLSVRGEHDKAVRAAQHAEALDPHADEAIEEAAWWLLPGAALRSGGAAIPTGGQPPARGGAGGHDPVRSGRESAPDPPATRAKAGGRRLPPGTIAFLRREASVYRVPPERLALLHAALGETSEAIGWLPAAVAAVAGLRHDSRGSRPRQPARRACLRQPRAPRRLDYRTGGLMIRREIGVRIALGAPGRGVRCARLSALL
jgi:hypothetical protein